MKKHLLAILALSISGFAMAQTSSPSFGIRGGMISSTMSGDAVSGLQNIVDLTDGYVTTSGRTGIYGGAYANIPLSDRFSVEPGVYYAQKGYGMKGSIDLKGVEFLGANAKAQLNASYIDIPVLLKANFNGFQVFAGPQVSYLANANLRTTAGLLGINLLNKTIDVTDQYNRVDAGITGGIGYQFPGGFNITASYDHGLARTDANKSLNAYNRAVKVGIGFSF